METPEAVPPSGPRAMRRARHNNTTLITCDIKPYVCPLLLMGGLYALNAR